MVFIKGMVSINEFLSKLLKSVKNLSAEFAEYEVKPTIYTYTELQYITRAFSMKLGHGAFGAVYKVLLNSCQKHSCYKLHLKQ